MAIRWNSKEMTEKDSTGVTDDSGGNFSSGLQQGYELGSLTDGLVAYYPFDGDVEDKALSNDGTDNTSAGFVSGKVGGEAKDFDGTDDYIKVGSNVVPLNSAFTISFWIQAPNVSENSYFFIQNTGSWGKNTLRLKNTGSDVKYYDSSGNSAIIASDSDITTGNWEFITITYNGSEVCFYNGGTKINSSSSVGGWSSGDLEIAYEAPSNKNYLDGQIDDLRIYDRALSRPEIEALYQRTSTQEISDKDRLTSGLVGHWPLNEDRAGKAYDLSGNNYDSTSVLGTAVSQGLGGTQARKFDGSGDYISTAQWSTFGSNLDSAHSAFAWVKLSESQTSRILHVDKSGGDTRYLFGFGAMPDISNYPDNAPAIQLRSENRNYLSVGASSSISSKEWHHVGYTKEPGSSASTIDIYVNGSSVTTSTNADDGASSFSNFDQNVPIGARIDGGGNHSNFIDGKIQDVRVYNRTLTASEIRKIARHGGINTQ